MSRKNTTASRTVPMMECLEGRRLMSASLHSIDINHDGLITGEDLAKYQLMVGNGNSGLNQIATFQSAFDTVPSGATSVVV